MELSLIIISISFLLIVVLLYFYIARIWAGNLLLRFLAESIILRNIHITKQATFIVRKSLENIDTIPLLVRPAAKWYINNRGIDITNTMLHFIILSLEEDNNIEIVKQ